ncbi:nuclease-related domain-containing protein [Mycoplasma sp. 1654_15]|uniref:nuclease-related domain-containing protein n=1 Tax=Mycoplasma sp. 1654_15 TaxID=2725994 RepID=UPI00144A2128|nr:nuclease-related domain-containing protein [Mycoplasma sp. 1654_15]QJB71363.1 NERD domain-containing protein [Mycoplasma sp. 1654_15]
MDNQTGFILGSTLGLLSLLIFFLIFLFFRFKALQTKILKKNKGKEYEKQVNEKLLQWAINNQSFFINSSILKKDNLLFEVDSILITKKAVIVIEIKSLNGFIKGDFYSNYWTKTSFNHQLKIYSPVFQNKMHIIKLQKLLNMPVPFLSLIIFSSKTKSLDITNYFDYQDDTLMTFESDMMFKLDLLMQQHTNYEISILDQKRIFYSIEQCIDNSKTNLKKIKKSIKNEQ